MVESPWIWFDGPTQSWKRLWGSGQSEYAERWPRQFFGVQQMPQRYCATKLVLKVRQQSLREQVQGCWRSWRDWDGERFRIVETRCAGKNDEPGKCWLSKRLGWLFIVHILVVRAKPAQMIETPFLRYYRDRLFIAFICIF